MRLGIQQSSGESGQACVGADYALTPTYTASPTASSAYSQDGHHSLPTIPNALGRRTFQPDQSCAPANLQFASSDISSFSQQHETVGSTHPSYHSQSAIVGGPEVLPSFSTSMQEQYSSPLYSPTINHVQMMGLSPGRHPAGIPPASSHRPRTESKPIIDPVDNKQLCTFFLRTGTCAYGDKCRFKHPKDRPPPQLNSRGYPIREGEPDCAHYLKRGWCAFGVTCKYNHLESTPYVPVPYQQPGFVPVPGMVTLPYIPAYTYPPPFTSSGLTAPAMYTSAAFPSHAAAGTGFRMPVGGVGSHSAGGSEDASVEKAAQSLEALTLQRTSHK